MTRSFCHTVGFLTAIACLVPTLRAQQDGVSELVVRGLSFEGNRAIDDRTLETSIRTSESAWFARFPLVSWVGWGQKRYFNETEFRRDVERVKTLYRVSGFMNVWVDTLVRRSHQDVRIRFLIDEGKPILVTSLDVFGVEGILTEHELQDLPLQVFDPFNRLRLRASADTLSALLRDRGHPFAEVFRSFDVDRDSRQASVSLEVDPGMRVTVGRVEIIGADRIDEAAVRRMISVRPGETFRQRDLYESQLSLYRMGAYSYVNIALADSALTGAGDSLVTVRVQVTEGPLQRVRLGVGYGTLDCFRTLSTWSVHNFLGGARSLSVSARLSQIGTGDPLAAGFENQAICGRLAQEDTSRLKLNYNLTVSLQEPVVFSRRTSATLSIFAERHSEFQAFLRQGVGGDISLTHQTRWDIPVTLSYSLSYGRTAAEAAKFCTFLNVCRVEDTEVFREDRIRAVLGLAVVRNRMNSPVNPTRGTIITAEARYASRLIGSDTLIQFTRGVVEYASHHRVGRRSVFAWRVRAGAIISPELGLTGQQARYVPPEDRFYAGGPYTVRGFSQNELGPLVRVLEDGERDTVTIVNATGDVTGTLIGNLRTSPTGGNTLFVANAEFRFPILGSSGRVSGAVYVDAGQVFNRGDELVSFRTLRITPGVGLRIASPLGPVRLDAGFNPHAVQEGPLYVAQGTNLNLVLDRYRPERDFLGQFRLHFSVGQAF